MVSKSSKYNQRVKQLEATAAQLLEASEQVSVEAAEQVEFQLILADGVCQQMVLYDVMMPKHQPWLDVEPCTAQQQVPEKQITISQSSRVVQLVDNCNPMLRAMFYVSVVEGQQHCWLPAAWL
jgi:hypothetical protein